LLAVVLSRAVERQDVVGRGDREADGSGEGTKMAYRLACRRLGEPGLQRLGGERADVQHLVGGALGGGGDAGAGTQLQHRVHRTDERGE
jgi:hypothetical protein